jgi:hypothetical protein
MHQIEATDVMDVRSMKHCKLKVNCYEVALACYIAICLLCIFPVVQTVCEELSYSDHEVEMYLADTPRSFHLGCVAQCSRIRSFRLCWQNTTCFEAPEDVEGSAFITAATQTGRLSKPMIIGGDVDMLAGWTVALIFGHGRVVLPGLGQCCAAGTGARPWLPCSFTLSLLAVMLRDVEM